MWGISEMANVDSVLMVGVHGSEPTREKALEKAGALLEEGGEMPLHDWQVQRF